MITYPGYTGKTLSFYGSKGLIKKIAFQEEFPHAGKIFKDAETYTLASENSEYAAALYHEVTYELEGEQYKNKRHKYTLYFYDDSGNLLWQKDLGFGARIKMSPDGKYIVVDNANWNLIAGFREGPEGPLDETANNRGLNVNQFKIFDYKGEEILNYSGYAVFKNLRSYGFSGNGRYFYAEIEKLYTSPTPPGDHIFLLYDLKDRKKVLEAPEEEVLDGYYSPSNPNIDGLTYNGDGIEVERNLIVDFKGNKILALDNSSTIAFNGKYLYKGDYLYDFADYLAAIKRGEKPKALLETSYERDFLEPKGFMFTKTHPRTEQEAIEWNEKKKNIPVFLMTLNGEILWKNEYYSLGISSDYSYLEIEKYINGRLHILYYKISD